VKLLLDENLSRRLVPLLQARFPGSSQVALLGLERSSDAQLCDFAAQHGFVICSKDDDFHRLVAASNYTPRLIHLALGNAGNDAVLAALLSAADRVCTRVLDDPTIGIVEVLT
jgi:predicted nuclease of predicted toxin-antitoxin system